jgi:peptidoglycan/xylan/chitin deacetylase (PgdA/CDA1 family)
VFDDQVEQFRIILRRLKAIGTFVSTENVLQMIRGSKPIDRCYFHLSFDDGYDNVYRNAFPLLKELGLPAAVFVPTLYVGASDDEARQKWWGKSFQLPIRPLRWEWVAEMADTGLDIGSHTRTHAHLSAISHDPQRLHEEVVGAKRDLEDRLKRPCRYISWPFGEAKDIDSTALHAIEEAGFDACFSAIPGPVVPGKTSVFSIPRRHFEPQWPWLHVRYFVLGSLRRGVSL